MALYHDEARKYNLHAIYNNCCGYCGATWGQKITDGCKFRTLILTIDHIITQSNEGSNLIKNLQILCNRCNAYKWAYNMPGLKPRQPELDAKKSCRKSEKIKRYYVQTKNVCS